MAGLANVIREGDGMIGLLLIAVLMVILLVQDGAKKYFINIPKKILIAVVLLSIYNLPWLTLNGVRRYRDQIYFQGKPSIMITHHGLWHNAFMGLGYIPNKYGIHWSDANNLPFVRKINPQAQYMSNEYFDILRRLYLKYSLESPEFWWKNYFAKLKQIHRLVGGLFPQQLRRFVPSYAYNYTFYLMLLGTFFIVKRHKLYNAIYWVILLSLIISSFPGLIGVPVRFYLRGFQVAYIMTWFLFLTMIYLRIITILKIKHV